MLIESTLPCFVMADLAFPKKKTTTKITRTKSLMFYHAKLSFRKK